MAIELQLIATKQGPDHWWIQGGTMGTPAQENMF